MILVFLNTEKSKSANPGPYTLFRATLPHVPGAGCEYASVLSHCTYGVLPSVGFTSLCEIPAIGFPATFRLCSYCSGTSVSFGAYTVIGCPPLKLYAVCSAHPPVSVFGPLN